MRTSGQQYKTTLTNIQRRLEPKVYKISSKPVYPMSSSSSESSSEEVVVVGRYWLYVCYILILSKLRLNESKWVVSLQPPSLGFGPQEAGGTRSIPDWRVPDLLAVLIASPHHIHRPEGKPNDRSAGPQLPDPHSFPQDDFCQRRQTRLTAWVSKGLHLIWRRHLLEPGQHVQIDRFRMSHSSFDALKTKNELNLQFKDFPGSLEGMLR